MNKETRDYVTRQCDELLKVPFACKEAKEVCSSWLKAKEGPKEKEASIAMLKELKEDAEPIDGLLAFAASKECKEHFGEKGQKEFLAHADALKKKGAKYCDCLACTAATNIIAKEKEILAD